MMNHIQKNYILLSNKMSYDTIDICHNEAVLYAISLYESI